MLFDMQSKHINYNSPKTKAVHLLCSIKSWHRHGGLGSYFCWKLDYPKSPSVFWHYLHKFCIAVWVVFTDQSCSVKSIIIALLSPSWHSLAHCARLLTSSKTEFSKNKFSQFPVLHIFFFMLLEKITPVKIHFCNFLLQTLQADEMMWCTKSHNGNADTSGLLVTERQGLKVCLAQ